jgi:thioredoxin-like negative regulator of GroEL
MRLLTSDDFHSFIAGKRAAAIHFDAEWDGHRELTRRKMLEAEQALGDHVNFGEVDIDTEVALAKSTPVANVPLVAYYLDGKLVAALIGTGQNVRARLARVLLGEPIGRRPGDKRRQRKRLRNLHFALLHLRALCFKTSA